MKLNDVLRFDEAKLTKFEHQPNEDGGKAILIVTAPLSRRNAEILDAAYLFVSDTVPRENAKLDGLEIEDADLEIGRSEKDPVLIRPERITSVKTVPVDDLGLEIHFRAHVVGEYMDTAYTLAKTMNKAVLNVVVRPIQGNIFADQQEAPESYRPTPSDVVEKAEVIAGQSGDVVQFVGTKAAALIRVQETPNGWRAGYDCSLNFRRLKGAKADLDQMIPFASEAMARGAAAAKIVEFSHRICNAKGDPDEKKSAREMMEWAEKFMLPEQLKPIEVAEIFQ